MRKVVSTGDMEILRADDRYCTTGDGMETRHTFSYGSHYDATNVGFGQLVAINEECVEPGQGYDLHHHQDVEIVTWVLQGTLQHEDTIGNRGIIAPGRMQRLSAGHGVRHSECNASTSEPLRFIQMMLRSDNEGEPDYAQIEITDGALVPGVPVNRAGTSLHVARAAAGRAVTIPEADLALLHVTRGSVSVGGHVLDAGDSARLTARDAYDLTAQVTSEVLIWQMTR